MKHKIRKQVTREEVCLAFTECDICHRRTTEDRGAWKEDDYTTHTIEVTHTRCESYEIGDAHGTSVEFDLCPDCFAAHIVTHLESLGASGRRYDFG